MIRLKSPDEVEIMRRANLIVAEILDEMCRAVKPGIATAELDRLAQDGIERAGAESAFKGYSTGGPAYPCTVCVSVNEEVVHGIPRKSRVLKEGDIVGIDFGVRYHGYYGDAARTVPVGGIDEKAKTLLEVTETALWAGIEEARAGRRLGDVSAAIQERVEGAGFSVVRDFVGHGIGRSLHEEPQVPNFGRRHRGIRLREGMVIAIEPMVNAGGAQVVVKDDGWTAITCDRSRSAHFEHSVAVTGNGPYVLSR